MTALRSARAPLGDRVGRDGRGDRRGRRRRACRARPAAGADHRRARGRRLQHGRGADPHEPATPAGGSRPARRWRRLRPWPRCRWNCSSRTSPPTRVTRWRGSSSWSRSPCAGSAGWCWPSSCRWSSRRARPAGPAVAADRLPDPRAVRRGHPAAADDQRRPGPGHRQPGGPAGGPAPGRRLGHRDRLRARCGCLVAGLVFVAARWRHGIPLVRQQVGWFTLGLLITLAGAAVLASGVLGAPVYSRRGRRAAGSRRDRRAPAPAVRGRPTGQPDPALHPAHLRRRRGVRARRRRGRGGARHPRRRVAAAAGHGRGGRRLPAAAGGAAARGQPADLRRLGRAAGAGPRLNTRLRAGGQPRAGAGRRPGRGRDSCAWSRWRSGRRTATCSPRPAPRPTPAGSCPSSTPAPRRDLVVGGGRAGGGTRRSSPNWPAPSRRRSRRPGCTPTCCGPASGWWSPGRRSAAGCGGTCTTASAPRSPG